MSQLGHVSALSLTRQTSVINVRSPHSAWKCGLCFGSGQMTSLSFGGGDSMGDKLKVQVANSVVMRSRAEDAGPLKVKMYLMIINIKDDKQ